MREYMNLEMEVIFIENADVITYSDGQDANGDYTTTEK